MAWTYAFFFWPVALATVPQSGFFHGCLTIRVRLCIFDRVLNSRFLLVRDTDTNWHTDLQSDGGQSVIRRCEREGALGLARTWLPGGSCWACELLFCFCFVFLIVNQCFKTLKLDREIQISSYFWRVWRSGDTGGPVPCPCCWVTDARCRQACALSCDPCLHPTCDGCAVSVVPACCPPACSSLGSCESAVRGIRNGLAVTLCLRSVHGQVFFPGPSKGNGWPFHSCSFCLFFPLSGGGLTWLYLLLVARFAFTLTKGGSSHRGP